MTTLTELAGEALVYASRRAKRAPRTVEVLFAFSLVTGLLLHRGGRATRAGPKEWAMHEPTVQELWPDVQKGMKAYLLTAPDWGGQLPDMREFFGDVVADGLAISADVRLALEAKPNTLVEVLSEQFGEHWTASDHSEKFFMIAVAESLFDSLR